MTNQTPVDYLFRLNLIQLAGLASWTNTMP